MRIDFGSSSFLDLTFLVLFAQGPVLPQRSDAVANLSANGSALPLADILAAVSCHSGKTGPWCYSMYCQLCMQVYCQRHHAAGYGYKRARGIIRNSRHNHNPTKHSKTICSFCVRYCILIFLNMMSTLSTRRGEILPSQNLRHISLWINCLDADSGSYKIHNVISK